MSKDNINMFGFLEIIHGNEISMDADHAEDSNYVFLEIKLRGLVPNFHFHTSVSESYISRIGPPIMLQLQIGRPMVGIYKSLTDIWMLKLGLRSRSFLSGNIFPNFRYSLCSA
jgi:hypothetical protein